MTFAEALRVGGAMRRVLGGRSKVHDWLLKQKWFLNAETWVVYHLWKIVLVGLLIAFLGGWTVAGYLYH